MRIHERAVASPECECTRGHAFVRSASGCASWRRRIAYMNACLRGVRVSMRMSMFVSSSTSRSCELSIRVYVCAPDSQPSACIDMCSYPHANARVYVCVYTKFVLLLQEAGNRRRAGTTRGPKEKGGLRFPPQLLKGKHRAPYPLRPNGTTISLL